VCRLTILVASLIAILARAAADQGQVKLMRWVGLRRISAGNVHHRNEKNGPCFAGQSCSPGVAVGVGGNGCEGAPKPITVVIEKPQ